MTAISARQPEVDIEYSDAKGNRKRKHFTDAHKAKRWYTIQDKLGREPRVLNPHWVQPATITEQLRDTIRKSGKSLNSIAIESGVPNPVVVRFVNKKQGLSLLSADKLATYFGLALVARGDTDG